MAGCVKRVIPRHECIDLIGRKANSLPVGNNYAILYNYPLPEYFQNLPIGGSPFLCVCLHFKWWENPGCSLACFTCFESCDQMQASDWLSPIANKENGNGDLGLWFCNISLIFVVFGIG